MKRSLIVFLFAVAAAMPSIAANRFHYDAAARRYSVEGPGAIENAQLGLEADGTMHWAGEAQHASWSEKGEARFDFPSPALRWTVRFHETSDALLITSTIENTGPRPLKLGRCRLLDVTGETGELHLGPDTVAMLMTGTQYPERVVRLEQAEGPLRSETLTQWFSPSANTALQFGFVSFDRAEAVIESGWNAARRMPTVSAWSDFKGFELAPGASIDSETLRIGLERDPYAALEAWADAVRERYHPRIWPKIPAGWLGWSWVDPLTVETYEDVVRRNVRAIRKRLPGHDIEYVWVSLGNLKGRLPGNWLEWNHDEFPSGPQALSQDLESLNFHLGLWAGAFWMAARSNAAEGLRDAFLLLNGEPTGYKHRDLGPMYFLDPTHPKTKAFLNEVFSTYRQWGVRYYMIDFLNATSGLAPGQFPNDGYYDKSVIRGPQAWREGLRTICEAAGKDTYLLASSGPTLTTIGLMDGVRAGNDYGEGRALDGPGKGFYPGTFVINNPNFWTSHSLALKAMAGYFFMNGKLFLADSGNVLTVDKPMPLADAQIRATIFGINGSPMMLGDDIDRMDEERLAIIRRVLPRLPECARPIDLFDAPEPDYAKVFDLPVKREWDRWDLVAVFNFGQHTIQRTVPLERLGLDPHAAYAVWDFWNERFDGVSRGSIDVQVAPESVRLLRIAQDREHPWLLSTDMHVRQGQAEILDCRWDAAKATLIIRTVRPGDEHGSVFVRAPSGWALADPKGLWIAKDGRDGSLVVRAAVNFAGPPVELRMRFRHAEKQSAN
ncbi:MAG TPA: hypothetical protein VKV15_01750 [Bryobacteraceae bacterium]|nr:hypothetical protein [Bryobacteraceae bacterium]